jgi:hypothetical protein
MKKVSSIEVTMIDETDDVSYNSDEYDSVEYEVNGGALTIAASGGESPEIAIIPFTSMEKAIAIP